MTLYACLMLPVVPSTNNLFRAGQGAASRMRFKTKPYKNWRTDAGWALKQQPRVRIAGAVAITISHERRDGDIDNRIKAVLDLLVLHEVIEEDRHVERVTAQWSDEVQGCMVEIEAISKEAA